MLVDYLIGLRWLKLMLYALRSSSWLEVQVENSMGLRRLKLLLEALCARSWS